MKMALHASIASRSIQEGLAVALSNVDEIIALIKSSPTPPEAKRIKSGCRRTRATNSASVCAGRELREGKMDEHHRELPFEVSRTLVEVSSID